MQVLQRATVSIHAPYAGSDRNPPSGILILTCFNPRPLCRERQGDQGDPGQSAYVSIHAPYAGSDKKTSRRYRNHYCFNPRPLCRERLTSEEKAEYRAKFQSTPPMQGATPAETGQTITVVVSIHAPYAGSDDIASKYRDQQKVSIHAPYAGSDFSNFCD